MGENQHREREPMSLDKILAYVQQLGVEITRGTEKVQAMLAIAQERGHSINLAGNEAVAKFTPPGGEHENALIRMQADLDEIAMAMYRQGVLVTGDELKAQLEKMRTPN